MVATNVFNDALRRRARRLPGPVRAHERRADHRRRPRPGPRDALALARDGYDIVALDVAAPLELPAVRRWARPRSWTRCAAEVEALGRACLTVVADVRDDAAVSAAVHDAIDLFGRIDVLFNNAGICAYGLAHELTEDEWDAMLDINLKGAWIVARHVIPHMIDGEVRRDRQQLLDRGPARDGPAVALRGVQVGPDRADEVVGDRARAARHPRRLDPPDRRRHAAQRRAGGDGGA